MSNRRLVPMPPTPALAPMKTWHGFAFLIVTAVA